MGMSPAHAPHLVLGLNQPDCTLVGPASHAMKVKQEGPFLLSAHHSTSEFILDVPFGKLNVHCHGDHGPLPIAAINIEHGTNKEHHNAARLFTLNADNTISPTKAPHLVFGMRGTLVESAVQPTLLENVVRGVAAVMGTPIVASAASASSASSEKGSDGPSLTLAEMVEYLKKQLGLEGQKSMNDVVHAAAAELGIETKGKALLALAKECLDALGFRQ